MSISNPITDAMARELTIALKLAAEGKRDPDQARKALEAAKLSRDQTRKEIGIVEVAVDLIRDARNQ